MNGYIGIHMDTFISKGIKRKNKGQGEKVATTSMGSWLTASEDANVLQTNSFVSDQKVDRARIELATHGFSGRCSTD